MKTSVCFLVALILLLPGNLCPVIKGKCKNLVDFMTNSALRCVITMLHLRLRKIIDGLFFGDGLRAETKIRRESSRG